MHFNIQVKIVILTLVLPLFFFSSCETYQSGSDYRTIAWNDAISAGIPANLFVKQIDAESHFNPYAVSPAGAIGMAQFMPETAQGLGIDPWNAEQSLQGAAQLMSHYVNKYGDYHLALAAYNCGSGCLQSAINNCGYYYWCLPPETRHYIDEVMS